MRLLLIPLAIALAIRPGPLASQQLPALRPGTRVRISSIAAGLQRQQGTVLGERGDTLDFRPNSCESACAVLKIPGEAVDRVEVFGGRSHVKGALVGGFVGGLFGAAVASSTTDRHANCESGNYSTCLGAAFARPFAIAGLFALAGAAIGGAVGIGSTWRDVPSASAVHLGLGPVGPRGVGLVLHAAF